MTFGQLPAQPKAWDQVSSAVSACKNDAQAMALLLGWLTAARLGCVRQLAKADTGVPRQVDGLLGQRDTVLSPRHATGKSQRLLGPLLAKSRHSVSSENEAPAPPSHQKQTSQKKVYF